MPQVRGRLEHYTGERPLFDLYNVETEIEKALSRRVELKSGGTLVIDQTEAMTTIDVNTGGFVGSRNFDDTVFKTNLEAAQAIARQLRLRNLGGIIIIDFIDMESEEHRNAVLDELQRALARDRTRITVERLHRAGPGRDDAQAHARVACSRALRALPDLRRARRGADRAHRLLRNPARDAARGARLQRAREYRVLAAQPVIDLFLEDESGSLAMLSDFIGKPISVQVETGYTQEQFDIVLM